MTSTTAAGELPLPREPSYLGAGHTLGVLAHDHGPQAHRDPLRDPITLFFFLGGAAISVVRLELFTPQADVVTADTYNKLFTFHGIVMVWFFMVPAIPATLGNFLLPLMIGAPDVAFPTAQPVQLVPEHRGAAPDPLCTDRRRRRHGLDLLHAVLDDVLEHARARRRARRVRRRASPRSPRA